MICYLRLKLDVIVAEHGGEHAVELRHRLLVAAQLVRQRVGGDDLAAPPAHAPPTDPGAPRAPAARAPRRRARPRRRALLVEGGQLGDGAAVRERELLFNRDDGDSNDYRRLLQDWYIYFIQYS